MLLLLTRPAELEWLATKASNLAIQAAKAQASCEQAGALMQVRMLLTCLQLHRPGHR